MEQLAEDHPEPLVLIGDDTSQDAIAYGDYQKENPGEVLQVYIHNVKNTEVHHEELKYLTAFDIAYNEAMNSRLPVEAAIKVANIILRSKDRFIIPPSAWCPTDLGLHASSGDPRLDLAREWVDKKVMDICRKRATQED